MSIITVGGIKGGSGKSTTAINITIALSNISEDVLLVDADDQESATDFTNWRNHTLDNEAGYTSVKLAGEAVRNEVIKLKNKYKYIIIDTGGRDTSSQRAAMSVSNLFLIPFVPRSIDIWTLEKVRKLIEEIKTINPTLKSLAFINKADVLGKDNEEAGQVLSEIKEITFLKTNICNRKSFSNSITQGLGINELTPKDTKAQKEFESFFLQIQNQLTSI
jgi:chromosome partitioning protein